MYVLIWVMRKGECFASRMCKNKEVTMGDCVGALDKWCNLVC